MGGSSDLISPTATEWTVNWQYNEVNRVRLKLYGLNYLKQIHIVSHSFKHIRRFGIINLSELETVLVGRECFQYGLGERNDGSFRIMNCPKLKSIQLTDSSFSDYHSFELSNLPSLQSIYIDVRCFWYAPSFSLTGLINGLACIDRSSSTTISQTWCRGIPVYSFGCV